ncbi:sulfite reductase (NADPH) flavoprotein alpha-component [Rhodococcus sp. 27YEA15]|uniref:diflavin oxidoreductase n=1 Tax=Rhodococcus sp. 27YEA15 TaxID=3156259 RepID=UPI003C7C4279
MPPSPLDLSDTRLHILYGSQTGGAQQLADDAAALARVRGIDTETRTLNSVNLDALASMSRVLVVTSTYGEGEMPDNAQLFWAAIEEESSRRFDGLDYAVLALGDSDYEQFCQAGRSIDERLAELGAVRRACRLECDLDYEDVAPPWLESTFAALVPERAGSEATLADPEVRSVRQWTAKNPFRARVLENRLLTGPGSDKEVRHLSLDLAGGGFEYVVGDGLSVVPVNDPVLVDAVLSVLAPAAKSDTHLREELATGYEISTPSRALITWVAQRWPERAEREVLDSGGPERAAWLCGKDVVDLISGLPEDLRPTPTELLAVLRPLQDRTYSISSAPSVHGDRVHLTVAVVRYRGGGRDRAGVCSTYLADRSPVGSTVGVFLAGNNEFRLPEDNSVPVVMIGPGTGIAPFRAFLQERAAANASGRTWLFFGDRTREHDFLYQPDLSGWTHDRTLDRLDVAFSRDQEEKVYVQHQMREHGKELFSWLEEGAYVYVCGDAERMAKDVEIALGDIVAEHGGFSDGDAAAYLDDLRRSARYRRDVY